MLIWKFLWIRLWQSVSWLPYTTLGALPAENALSFIFCFLATSWTDFEYLFKTFGVCFPAYVGSVTTSTPSGLLNNISKAIKPSFQENARGSAVSGWKPQPNYFQLVVNCREVDFTSLERQLPLIKSRLCWRQ